MKFSLRFLALPPLVGCLASCGLGENTTTLSVSSTNVAAANTYAFDGEILISANDFDDSITVFDARTGGAVQELNTPFLGFSLQAAGGKASFGAREFDTGDMNGDGDVLDSFPILADAEGNFTAFPIAVEGGLGMSEHVLGIISGEPNNGDMNGDGDAADIWVHAQNGQLGSPFERLEVQAFLPPIAIGEYLAIAAFEGLEEADHNGDGDKDDAIFFLYHAPSRELYNAGKAWRPTTFMRPNVSMADGLVAFEGNEFDDDEDLNMDGDKLDTVVRVFDPVADTLVTTDIRGAGFLFDGRFVLGRELEFETGVDLNEDDDLSDSFLRVLDLTTGEARIVGQSASLGASIEAGRVRFVVDEMLDTSDLNEDGDLDDVAVHILDLITGEEIVWPWEPQSPVLLTETHAAAYFREAFSEADVNGDGDAEDIVLRVVELESGNTRNLTMSDLGNDLLLMNERALAFIVEETDRDLNGDGDTDDEVAYAHDLATGRSYNLGLATVSSRTTLDLAGDRLAVMVPEDEQGRDLNGDGDEVDLVMFVVRLFVD